MEWKLFWILNTVGWDTIYSAEKEKKKKKRWAEQTDFVLFHVPQAECSKFLTWLQEMSCIPAQVSQPSTQPLMALAHRTTKQPMGTDRSCWPFLRSAQATYHTMSAGIVYTSKTTMISPQINNEKELSSGKKKIHILPKRLKAIFLFSSYFGKTLTSWAQS